MSICSLLEIAFYSDACAFSGFLSVTQKYLYFVFCAHIKSTVLLERFPIDIKDHWEYNMRPELFDFFCPDCCLNTQGRTHIARIRFCWFHGAVYKDMTNQCESCNEYNLYKLYLSKPRVPQIIFLRFHYAISFLLFLKPWCSSRFFFIHTKSFGLPLT